MNNEFEYYLLFRVQRYSKRFLLYARVTGEGKREVLLAWPRLRMPRAECKPQLLRPKLSSKDI